MRVRVRVIEDDISMGVPENNLNCPIAYAIRRVTSLRIGNMSVDDLSAEILQDGEWLSAILPPVAQEFVRRFDQGEEVEPIEFDLDFEE